MKIDFEGLLHITSTVKKDKKKTEYSKYKKMSCYHGWMKRLGAGSEMVGKKIIFAK
jgi:hypothetical protein